MAYFFFDKIIRFLYIYGACFTIAKAQECDVGWNFFKGVCYFKGTVVSSWPDARDECSSMDGALATVNSQEKQTYLRHLIDITELSYWIGLNDMATTDGTWVWDAGDDPGFTWSGGTVTAGGVPSPATAYYAWLGNQPNNLQSNQYCVRMVNEESHASFMNFEWDDAKCTNEIGYVCQKQVGNVKLSSVIYVTHESSKKVTYQIVREEPIYSGQSVTLSTEDMTAVDGTDYKGVTDLTVQFDDAVTKMKTESIVIYTDFVDEGPETFKIVISSSSLWTSVTGPEAPVIILDSEPSVSTSGMFTFEKSQYDVIEGDAVTIQICRAGDLTATASVELRTTELDAMTPGDFTDINNMPINFAIGADKSDPISINTFEDAVAEPMESFELTLVSSGVKISTAVVWIKDDDEPCPDGCGNRGFCMESINTCWCLPGYTGDQCQISLCPLCQNGGICMIDTCHCPQGYTGDTCQTSLCPTCLNGGFCIIDSCQCPLGYTGDTCQTSLCVPVCQNGGVCAGNSICLCLPGFIGVQCQSDRATTFTIKGQLAIVSIDGVPAVFNPDFNIPGSVAREALLGYIMPLFNQFIGPLSGVLTIEVASFSRGSTIAAYTVTLESYSPTTADDIDLAITTLIRYSSSSGLLIDSTSSFTREPCPQACENGGFCVESTRTCQCPSGYSGDQCQIKPCPEGCGNGGFCMESSSTCWCPQGYTGNQCQTSLCVPFCQNGGLCTRNGICLCPPGFVGAQCHIDADSTADLSRDQGTALGALSGGEIAGIIIGVLAIILLMIVSVILVCVYTRQRRAQLAGMWSPSPAATPNINTLDLALYPYTYPRLDANGYQNTMLF